MNAGHDELHEARIVEIVTGDRDRSELADCEVCRRELAALLDAATRLDAAGAEQREVVRDAAAARAVPGEERVGALVEAMRRGSRPSRRPRALVPLGVAAAVAAAVLVWIVARERDVGNGTRLGSGVRCDRPVGTVSGFDEFEWTAERPAGGSFEVEVREDAADDGKPPVARRTTSEPRWRPEPVETISWPPRIRWTVNVRDATGAVVARDSARASRSPR